MANSLSVDALLNKNDQDVKIESCVMQGSRLNVTWMDKSLSQFPLILLRDCCPCKKCFSPTVNSRLTLFEQMMQFSTDVDTIESSSTNVSINWNDGHSSEYKAAWLYNRRVEKSAIEQRLESLYTACIDTPWSSIDPNEIIKKATYNEVSKTSEGVVKFTEHLIKNGLFVIENAPDSNCLVDLLKQMHATHSATHYGQNEWSVKNDTASKALPNSSKKLELHIDMPYMSKPCQLQLLHCQIQAQDGGENKFSDALKAALLLKEQSPEDYHILSTVEVDFQFIKEFNGQPWFIVNRAPIICEDLKTGLPTLCRFAAEVRCSQFNQPADVIEQWYKSFRKFWEILESNVIFIKSKPGDIVAFNNGRIMHAREAFDKSQARKLEGIYAEWDYLLSAWRVAKTQIMQREQ